MIERLAAQFNAGGNFMWIILFVLGFAVAVMIERLFYLYIYCYGSNMNFVKKVIAAIKGQKVEDAKKMVADRSSPMHRLLYTAVDQYASGATQTQVMEKVEQSAIRELPRLQKRINYLSLVANVATLLGLLGTIMGLQLSFSSLADVDTAQRASMLAMGISQAMNTTAFGLIVAVPCMVMFTFLSNKQQALVKNIDEGISHLLSALKESE
ncbi:MotA/TolQ/ExbB proton channel family protein [Chitinispirillales bacterium ANBcel5]|uniref:MotA/TolQ/ExbB proton channel family protein n=1 Tax=Cellulosispirillum alkaliphilum TaxID=3039283 RepID=UPI002A56BDA5|nr:MotA/TolQ/ExbB proton channel family protein [Chitinispirillales bacterium ANBcel5]